MALSSGSGSAYSLSLDGKEQISHGTPAFPAAFYLEDLGRNRVPWHWHDELEAVFIPAGEAWVTAGRRRFHLKEGQGFFINTGVLHSADAAAGRGCLFHSAVFHPRLIGGEAESVFWQNYLRPLTLGPVRSFPLDDSLPWHREALERIENAWQAAAAGAPGFEFRVRAELSALVFLLAANLPGTGSPPSEKALRDSDRIKQMLRFIQLNYADELTVPMIAAAATVSESECLRCFRGTIGMTPIRYVKRFRVRRAAELLASTDKKIGEIGAECGFEDPGYFTRAFREIKGLTPGQYREQLLSGHGP